MSPSESPSRPLRHSGIRRRPLVTRHLDLHGYEVTLRDSTVPLLLAYSRLDAADAAGADAGDDLQGETLLVHAHESLIEKQRAFIQLRRDHLLSRTALHLPADSTTFVLAAVGEIDAAIIKACAEHREAGFGIMVTDGDLLTASPDLLELATHARCSFGEPASIRHDCVAACHAHDILPLAVGIDTRARFTQASDEGFELFDGRFYLEPELIRRADLLGSSANYLRFMRHVQRPDLDFVELERLIQSEPALAMRLLRHLNSAAFNWTKEVTSIRQALILLGERPLKRWAAVLALAELGKDRPAPLLRACLMRARFCERMAACTGLDDQKMNLFYTGLLSCLDAIVGRPRDELMHELGVPPLIADAVLGADSFLGHVLRLALAFESGTWDEVARDRKALGVSEENACTVYLSSAAWAREVMES